MYLFVTGAFAFAFPFLPFAFPRFGLAARAPDAWSAPSFAFPLVFVDFAFAAPVPLLLLCVSLAAFDLDFFFRLTSSESSNPFASISASNSSISSWSSSTSSEGDIRPPLSSTFNLFLSRSSSAFP
jgi:hypothetical protein